MKRFLTFALALAMVCTLSLPSFAGNGKGNEGGKSAVPYNGPKAKHPKDKTPPTTPPTNPTTPPVILLQGQTLNKNTTGGPTFAKQTLVKQNLSQQNLSKPKFAKSDIPPNLNGAESEKFKPAHGSNQNSGPFPPFHCGTQPGNNGNNNDGHCGTGHNGHNGNQHCEPNHGNDGQGVPPIDPGTGNGQPSFPNPPARPGFVWVPANGNVPGHWERERAPTTPMVKPGFVWVPATATVPGHWERAKAQ
jgi:hypothetical protein